MAKDGQYHHPVCHTVVSMHKGWLVGCFGFNGQLRQYFSLYRAVSQRKGEREEKKIDESKNVQITPTRTYYKCSRPLPYYHQKCRRPRHWKLTQDHRTTRPPPCIKDKRPLHQYKAPMKHWLGAYSTRDSLFRCV